MNQASTVMLSSRICCLMLILCVLSPFAGCRGDRRVAIEGRVTLDGQPVENGTISFLPVEGTQGPSSGAAILGGRYKIPRDKGPFVGTYQVEIQASRKTGKKISAEAILGMPSGSGAQVDETVEAIPARYNRDSTLRREVQSGRNVLDFELSAKSE